MTSGAGLLKKLSSILKIIVSVAILIFVFRKVNLAQTIQYIEEIRPGFLLVSVVLIIAGQVVRAQRLAVMLFGDGARENLWAVLRIQMVSFLPGVISPAKVGEVTKIFMLQADLDIPTERGLVCFVAERVFDLLVLSPLAAMALYVFYKAGLEVQLEAGWKGLAVSAIGVFIMALLLGALFARSRGISFGNLWRAASPRGMVKAGAFSLLYWLIVFLEVWCFCKAAGFDARPLHMALVVPPALLSSMIPITFSGFGIRELAMTILLQSQPVASSYEQAILVSLMYVIVGLGVPALMGALFWVVSRKDAF
jgi:uncharacterized membrane protein YbhN (UPF0104 family)